MVRLRQRTRGGRANGYHNHNNDHDDDHEDDHDDDHNDDSQNDDHDDDRDYDYHDDDDHDDDDHDDDHEDEDDHHDHHGPHQPQHYFIWLPIFKFRVITCLLHRVQLITSLITGKYLSTNLQFVALSCTRSSIVCIACITTYQKRNNNKISYSCIAMLWYYRIHCNMGMGEKAKNLWNDCSGFGMQHILRYGNEETPVRAT